MNMARALATENPELLLTSSMLPASAAKKAGGPHFAALYEYSDDDDYSTPAIPRDDHDDVYFAAAVQRERKPFVRRPGEPPRNDALTCTVCMARFSEWTSAGKGHVAEWCGRVLGPYDPKDPNNPKGPADDAQIIRAIELALKLARSEKIAKSRVSNGRPTNKTWTTPAKPAPTTPLVAAAPPALRETVSRDNIHCLTTSPNHGDNTLYVMEGDETYQETSGEDQDSARNQMAP